MTPDKGIWVRLTAAIAFAGFSAALAVSGSSAGTAAQKEEKGDLPAPPKNAPTLLGALACKECHAQSDFENPAYKATQSFDFVRLWENRIWEKHDLHQMAYKNLLTSRSVGKDENKKLFKGGDKPVANATAQKMEDNLIRSGSDEKKYRAAGYTVSTDTQCLACHASTSKPIASTPVPEWTMKTFNITDGIGCEMCHGHGSNYRDKHRESREADNAPNGAERVVDWREWSPDVKEKWGLVNLRDPLVATDRCASCHIGNAKEGRFVTHEMFAAGHPPLPPLDLVAYNREQPRHWGLPTEMPYLKNLAEKNPKKAFEIFHIRGDESPIVRRFAESALAVLHATSVSTNFMANEAKSEAGGGLDFAVFDCYACHHDLKYPSDRQSRGYAGYPGRPLYRPAPFALAKLIVQHASELKGGEGLKESLKELDGVEKDLAKAFASRSLGDPSAVAEATSKLDKWSTETVHKLAGVKYDKAATVKLLDMLDEVAQKPIGDPEVAQLYSWAFETLVLDLSGPPKREKGKTPEPPPLLAKFRKEVDGVVVSRLRPNANFYYEQWDAPGDVTSEKTLQSVSDRIQARMKLFNSFQFDPFAKAFLDAKPNLPK